MNLWISETETVEVSDAPRSRASGWFFVAMLLFVISVGGWLTAAHYDQRFKELQASTMDVGREGGFVITIGHGGWTAHNGWETEYADFGARTPLETQRPGGLDYSALDVALLAWEKELGRKITRPALTFNDCNWPNAIACAERRRNRITVTEKWYKLGRRIDRETVMMHEVGHLLGVPHIEGDDLMGPTYTKIALLKPTPFAVAIARAAESKEPAP